MTEQQHRFIVNLLAYVVQRNVSLDDICRLCQLDEQAVRSGRRLDLSEKQLSDIWLNSIHLTSDPLLGLHFGESLQVAALGVVGELVKNSQTIGEAVTHAAAFTPLVTDLFTMDVSHTAQTFMIRFMPAVTAGTNLSLVQQQVMDAFMAFTIHEVDGLILTKVKPQEVSLPNLLASELEYQRILRCPQIRQGTHYELIFERSYWQMPILTANYELQSQLLKRAEAIVQELTEHQPLRKRVLNYLQANAYLGIPSIDDLAANFNSSPRSVQRKLQEEGVSYQQLADSVRKTLALHYIRLERHPIKEISYMLGYNELSAFTRAFKRWTGTSPASYRNAG